MAKVKLHRCAFTFFRSDLDACWRLQRALDEQGVDYEVVKQPWRPHARRTEIKALTGQAWLPVIQFEDGSTYREETDAMAATVRAGRLFERAGGETGGA